MAKGTGGHYRHPHQAHWRSVQMPADAGVQRLLTGTGTLHERLFCEMASRADPLWGAQRTVTYPEEKHGDVRRELVVVLTRARAAGDPAADGLAKVAAQLGYLEPAAEPEPAPEPVPAPQGTPAPAPAPVQS